MRKKQWPNTDPCGTPALIDSQLEDVYYGGMTQSIEKHSRTTLSFLYKQPVYKQLAPGWQIADQLSGLNPVSLRNNKNYRFKKSGVFPL